MAEFEKFPKIQNLGNALCCITQKLDGTNGAIWIDGNEIKVGSRTRWLSEDNDNFGFCKFVMENKDEVIRLLGDGRHFGEWCGPGIQSGEGLSEREFILFDWYRYQDLPARFRVVPVLNHGIFDYASIQIACDKLKTYGSALVSGFTNVEGIVVALDGKKFKKVLRNESTTHSGECGDLLHDIRAEKIFSVDEKNRIGFPANIQQLIDLYIADLESENYTVVNTKSFRESVLNLLIKVYHGFDQ